MLASTSTKESVDPNNVKELNKFGVKCTLKTAAIFGANGSGKSNLITSLMYLKDITLNSLNYMDEPLTRNTIPFLFKENYFDISSEFEISFLAWFRKLKIISGLEDLGFKNFTIDLFDKDEKFKKWAAEILKSIQINDLEMETEQNNYVLKNESFNHEISVFGSKEIKTLNAIKPDESNNKYSIPLSVKFEGARKLIYLLEPLYDVISNNYVLVVNEFDNKLHSLLCKFIIDLYNQNNIGDSQLIISCHDTYWLKNYSEEIKSGL